MYYDDFKAMLKKKTSSFKTVDMSPEELAERAERFLGMLSVRRYIGPVTVDSLLDSTYVDANPLFPLDNGLEEIEEGCKRANEMMRSLYGNISEEFQEENASAVKEYIAWMAIFPEKQEALNELVFPEENDREETEYCGFFPSGASRFVLRPLFCDIGDVLPLPKAFDAVNASMIREIMNDESEEYEEKVRLVKLLVPGDPEEEEG